MKTSFRFIYFVLLALSLGVLSASAQVFRPLGDGGFINATTGAMIGSGIGMAVGHKSKNEIGGAITGAAIGTAVGYAIQSHNEAKAAKRKGYPASVDPNRGKVFGTAIGSTVGAAVGQKSGKTTQGIMIGTAVGYIGGSIYDSRQAQSP
jgi:hypothetical protein